MSQRLKFSGQQIDFYESKTKGTIYLGGLGTGKSFILIFKAIQLALEGKRGLFLTYSLNNIRDNIVPLFREIFSLMGLVENINYTITKSPAINVVVGDVDIMLRTASEPDKLRGPSVSFVMFEEGRELTRQAFDIGLGRLRKGKDLQWFIASTTAGKDWMYDLVLQEDLTDIFEAKNTIKTNDHCTVVRASTRNKWHVPHLSQEYIDELQRQYTTSLALQELDAKIVDFAGSLIDSKWFKYDSFNYREGIRFWDIATTVKDTSDYSSGVLMKRSDEGKYYISDIINVKLSYPDLKKLIIKTAIDDTNNVIVGFEQAGQQQMVIDDIRRVHELSQFNIKFYHPTKDKLSRSYPLISQIELGNVYLNKASWNKNYIDQCVNFSKDNIGKAQYKDDMIDATIGAYSMLTKNTSIITTRW